MDSIAESGAYGPGAVKLPFPVWREAFMNDADLALAEKTYELTTPHPLRTLTDPVPLKSFPELQIPRSYLNCTEDIAMPPGEFAWCPRFPGSVLAPTTTIERGSKMRASVIGRCGRASFSHEVGSSARMERGQPLGPIFGIEDDFENFAFPL